MASGGSSRRPMLQSRSLDVGSNELLFYYDDYTQQKDQTANAERSDSSAKDLHENRIGRQLGNIYGQQEEFPREDVICAVEICMKKYADNLMRDLQEIGGRLNQLELFCYKLERSISEFRTDMIHGQSEADMKLKSLEKHVHEVQRSLQIIRDKQELSETEELTKLHLSQKETVNSSLSQRKNEDVTVETSDTKPQHDNTGMSNLQLALALPNQISSSHPIRAPDQNLPRKELPVQQPSTASLNVPPQDRYILNQASTYYTDHQPPPQEQHIQHLQPELHYTPQRAPIQNLSLQASPQQQPPFSPYQQQWPQQVQPQQPSSQNQVPRSQTPPIYPFYAPYQTAIPEAFQGSSMPLPTSYSPLQSSGYGGAGSNNSHPPPHHNMQRQPPPPTSQESFAALPPLVKSGNIGANPYPPQSNMQGYNPVFAIDGSRASHPKSYQPSITMPTSQMMRNHPYEAEMIEKAVSMGYARDHVVSIINRRGETGEPLDFNALLDGLNSNANGGPSRAWSR